MKQIDPYSPWYNSAQGDIRDLNKGYGRKILRSGAPKKLWYDCLELEACIWLNTDNEIFMLNGDMSQTIMYGETSNISQFYELDSYEHTMFIDELLSYTEMNPVLGIYLVPIIDVVPDLTDKIFMSNVEVIHNSIYRAITLDEIHTHEHKYMCDRFDDSLSDHLGLLVSPNYFEDLGIEENPNYDFYDNYTSHGGILEPSDEGKGLLVKTNPRTRANSRGEE